MRCRRTANAGVLIELDAITILLDGMCRKVEPYLETPQSEKESLYACLPDIVAFTHGHLDHFDRRFAQDYCKTTLRSVLGPEGLLKEGLCTQPVTAGNVRVTPIPSRHIGKAGQEVPHVSFLIEGSKRILFTGDSTPVQWRDMERVDVLIAPYAYATTPAGWRFSAALAENMILVHMPERSNDPYDLWTAVKNATQAPGPKLYVPSMGQSVDFL